MEHRLIEGGAIWLPFARSRIKALLSLGIPYASQKYTMPDGAQCVVWIEPGQEYIRLSGSSGMGMDSGAVDLITINELADPEFLYAPGILYETEAVSNYVSGYALKAGAKLRTNSTKDNNVQIAGKISYSAAFSGAVPVDKQVALSFRARQKTDPLDSTKQIANPDDNDVLYAKKLTAAWCPASIFTGRCRLYVQAMYGAFFANGSKLSDAPALVMGGLRTPYLNLSSYTPSGNTDILPLVPVWTSSGVYFDHDTGKHWLISAPAGDGKVYVYPLISSLTGESWRKFLRNDSKVLLNSEAKEHLEAHILAYCLPDHTQRQTIDTAFNKQDYGCGYGWHFNWTGDTADIVTNEVWQQGGGNLGTTSTHYRLNLSFTTGSDGIMVAAASVSTIETVNWSSLRDLWSVIYPDYRFSMFTKLFEDTTQLTYPIDAPFYVFYQRDVLQMCRMQLASHSSATETSASPYSSSGNIVSAGDQDGFYTSSAIDAYNDATVTVGAESFGPCPDHQARTDTSSLICDKVNRGMVGGYSYGYFDGGDVTLDEGYPSGFNIGWSTKTILFGAYRGNGAMAPIMDFSVESRISARLNTMDRGLVAIIPFDDAESICVRVGVTYQEAVNKTGTRYIDNGATNRTAGGSWWWGESWAHYDYDPVAHNWIVGSGISYQVNKAYYVTGHPSPGGWIDYGTGYTSNVTTYDALLDKCVLFAGGGNHDADVGTIVSMAGFFVPGDYVEKYMRVSSGANVATPAIYTTGFNLKVGMPPDLTLSNSGQGPVALLGWT